VLQVGPDRFPERLRLVRFDFGFQERSLLEMRTERRSRGYSAVEVALSQVALEFSGDWVPVSPLVAAACELSGLLPVLPPEDRHPCRHVCLHEMPCSAGPFRVLADREGGARHSLVFETETVGEVGRLKRRGFFWGLFSPSDFLPGAWILLCPP
ncbi:MAG: hypothetical protein ABIJ46_00290, partial [bacterium]